MKILVTFLFTLLFCFEACAQGDPNPSFRYRFMKTFTAFLFALLFCSNAVADNADRTKGVYDQEKLKKDIVVYRKELEKCDKNFDEMAHKAYSTAEMVESSDYLADCCQALAEKIIDEQYSKRAEDHKKALSAYIQAAYDISNIIYLFLLKCKQI